MAFKYKYTIYKPTKEQVEKSKKKVLIYSCIISILTIFTLLLFYNSEVSGLYEIIIGIIVFLSFYDIMNINVLLSSIYFKKNYFENLIGAFNLIGGGCFLSGIILFCEGISTL